MTLRLFLVAAVLLASGCRRESELPKLFPVPNAKLVTQSGAPVQLDSMKGYVTVYDFIFTTCGGTCPLMSNQMKALTKQIDPKSPVRFVSISVDPARDTPEALRKYAARLGNDSRWLFLTGDRDTIVKLSVEGFKLAAGGDPQPGAEPLLHSSKIVVADKQGVIREYYGATSDDAVAHVAATVKELVQD
jgi:protein SCO1/2